MSAWWPDAASCVEGAAGMVSPLRMIGAGAAGGIGGSGVANGVSQSHNERLSGRRARPSHDGGAFDQIAQPPSCDAITQMMSSRRHIFECPCFPLSPDAGDHLVTPPWSPAIGRAAYCRPAGWLSLRRDRGWPTSGRRHRHLRPRPWHWQSMGLLTAGLRATRRPRRDRLR